ncbi:MAG: HAEPLYID family protein [Sediminibacterium sp.]
MKYILLLIGCFIFSEHYAQTDSVRNIKHRFDSLYIKEVQDKRKPDKVLHAEPLFIDLIRDLGARKGEREWNIGLGLTDNHKYDLYTALVEYEFAPVNRLGFEVEFPLSLHSPLGGIHKDSIPGNRLNGLKLATQYSFFVSEKMKTSLAIGYIHEFMMPEFRNIKTSNLVNGHMFNPFFIAAKRWGNHFHTLLYTGPQIEKEIAHKNTHTNWQVNTNFHYMIPGTRNFVGVEFNKDFRKADFDMVIRPQMRVSVADNLLIGIVAGVPVKRENQRFSSFLRLIYEPGQKHQRSVGL